jgi:cytoskeleton protein RodZ
LAAARQARKLEIVRVATELRLSPETVDALERDDFDHLPSPVFVSGYIRTYARLLGMDPQPLIARFHVLHPGAEAPPRSALENQELARSGSGWMLPLLLSAVVLVAAGGYLWWTGSQVDPYRSGIFGSGPDQDVAGTEPADATQPDDEPYDESLTPPTITAETGRATDDATGEPGTSLLDRPATDGDRIGTIGATDSMASLDGAATDTGSKTGSSTGSNMGSAPTLPSPDVALLPQPLPPAGPDVAGEDALGPETDSAGSLGESTSETASEDAPEANQVVVSFDGPCWVDVRDAAGEVQLFGEMADGDRHVLGGEPPYSLVIGNASAVTMTVGGAPFDVRAIAKGNVARFELDPADIVAAPEGIGAAASPSDN